MAIGLLMKGFSYGEMLEWDDATREWWYEKTVDYREREKAEYNKGRKKR